MSGVEDSTGRLGIPSSPATRPHDAEVQHARRYSAECDRRAESALSAAKKAGTGGEQRTQLERAAIYADLAEWARWPRE